MLNTIQAQLNLHHALCPTECKKFTGVCFFLCMVGQLLDLVYTVPK
jgi:hypothetical protein